MGKRRQRRQGEVGPGRTSDDSTTAGDDSATTDIAPQNSALDAEPVGSMSTAKRVASLVILFHLCALVLPPLAFQTSSPGQPSTLFASLFKPFQGYAQFLYTDRGYAFFAPNPGPSNLIGVAMETPDGSVQEVLYPDLNQQWPRLLYHRHFMMTEYLNELYWPPGPPAELTTQDPEAARLWKQRRGRYEAVRDSIVRHLKQVNEGRDVKIRRLRHHQPDMLDYRADPIALNDERLYEILRDQAPTEERIEPLPSNDAAAGKTPAGDAASTEAQP
ncbi:MAG: hypothetical protein CBB71_22465 [Rhodopirellula sp. TMED11]|nr:MAG: hypothetical protein CBB71_22465 [Rhodopirellula sp. TMED11]